MIVVPVGIGIVAENAPCESATVATTVLVLAGDAGWPAATSTRAPGVVVPVTTVLAPVTVAPLAGEAIVTGVSAGAAGSRYRARVSRGWSIRVPAWRSSTNLRYCAWPQISGAAEPAALPLLKPIEAVVGSAPNGDAGVSGSSHTCSGTYPKPQAIRWKSTARPEAAALSPDWRSCSARSPLSSGHRWPEPTAWVNHGSPVGEQVVGSGT